MKKIMPLPTEATRNMIEAAVMDLPISTGNPRKDREAVAMIWRTMCEYAPPAKTGGLTRKMAQVHEIIADYINEHGMSPTYEEIGKQTGDEKGNIHRICKSMRKRGFLTIAPGGHIRSLRLVIRPGEEKPAKERRK